MEPSQTEKKVSDISQSQRAKVHSLFKVPFLYKGSSGSNENVEESRNLDVASQASTYRHPSSLSARSDLSKDPSKEGTGRKLLNMLRKTLKGSESKELDVVHDIPALVPFGDVVGCLAVHIKNCRHFSPRKNNERRAAIKFEEVKYFSVQVPRRQDDERNMVYLELMEFDDLEAYPILLGSFSLHLYEIIQKGCFTEEFYMKIRNLVVCKVEVEFMFSYGNFGYGFSHQLKPLQKIIQPSMFMHVPPPVERTDPLTNVITPQLIEYPAFLSPDLNVTVGTQQKQSPLPSPVRLEKLQQQPRDRLDRMKKEYRNLKTWEEKSCYLDKILHMKTEPKDIPDNKDTDGNDDIFRKHDSQLPASFSQPPEFSFKKQEDKPLPSELPVETPEVTSFPAVEMRTEPPDSRLTLQEDAETKNGSLPPEESTPLPPVSLKEKDVCVEPVDERDDELVFEITEPQEPSERQSTDSILPDIKSKHSLPRQEKTDSFQSDTKLKSIILSPDRKKKSIDSVGSDTKRQILKQESKRNSELLQDPKEDIETVSKVHLPRHVSFNISNETIELPTPDMLNKDENEENINLDEDKNKNEEREKYKEGVGEKNEANEEEREIAIRHTYLEDISFRQARPESMPPFQGCQKSIINREKFEPFLRNIIEIPVEEDDDEIIQDVPICTVVKKNTSSTEVVEHEDQDPPFPLTSSSLTVNSENSSWDSNPDIFTIKSLDTDELERGLSSLSLESFEGESSFTIDIDLVGNGQECLLSELLNLSPSLEKLQKTVILKSILNDDLKELSEELFSQELIMEVEVEEKKQNLQILGDKGLSNAETDVCESAQKDLKIVQSKQISLSGKKSSSSKSSKHSIKDLQSEQNELSGKISSSSKLSKNDLKSSMQSERIELSGKTSSSSKPSKSDRKSDQIELSGKTSSSSKFSKIDRKSVQCEQAELLGKTSSKSSKNDIKIVLNEQTELSGKTSSKSSKNDLKIVQSEQIGLAGKTSSSSKSSKIDIKSVQSEQTTLSGKASSSSKSSKNDLKSSMQSDRIELSGKTSSGSKSSKNDLKVVPSEQIGLSVSGKSSSSSKSSKSDTRIVQGEQVELSGKISSSSKPSKSDLKVVLSEQIGLPVSGKSSSSLKSSRSESGELLGKPTSGSKLSSKNDLKIVPSEQVGLSGKSSSGSKPSSKQDLKISPSEQTEISGKISSSSKPSSRNDLNIVPSDQIVLSGVASSSSKSLKNDIKIVLNEQTELSGKTSPSSKSSKNDLNIVHSEQVELLAKTSSSSKSSKNDLNTVQSELSAKTSSSSKSLKNDLNIVQSEQIELSGKLSSSSKSSKNYLNIVQNEQIELSGKSSSSPKSSKNDLTSMPMEQAELLEKTSPRSSKNDLSMMQNEQIELSEKPSSSSKSSKNYLNIVQSEQIELSGKISSGSKSSKNDLMTVQNEQTELSGKTSSSSKSSKNDLKIVQSEHIELSGKTSSSSKSSRNDLKIVPSEEIELPGKKSLSSKSFSKEVLRDSLMERPSQSQIVEFTGELDCYVSQTFDERPGIGEGFDLSSSRKRSFKKKHSDECFQNALEEAISSVSFLSVPESNECLGNEEFKKKGFSEPQITELDLDKGGKSVSVLDFADSSLTFWDSSLTSSQERNESKHSGLDLSKSKSFVSHVFLQAFPSDSRIDSGIVGVIELDKEHYQSQWLDTEITSEEKPPTMEGGQKLSTKSSKKQFPHDKDLPSVEQSSKEKDLSSVLENASTFIMHELTESDRTHIKSFVSDVFKNFSTESVPEAELEKEDQNFFVADCENEFEELEAASIQSLDKLDDVHLKPAPSRKHSGFAGYLSGSDTEHLTADLSKHIQSFLVERFSETGHFSKEDLPKIFEHLYLINDKIGPPTSLKAGVPPKEHKNFKDFPDNLPKRMPSVKNANHPLFDDSHFEICLRTLLSEILQQYLLCNYSETKVSRERESENRDQSLPSYRTKTVPSFSCEVKRDYSDGSFSGESEINLKSPLNQSIQDLLSVISESELLHLKSDLSKRLQNLFIERLSNMGVITEKEFHTISENLSLINSRDRPLKFVKTDVRGVNQYPGKPSERQSKCYKTFSRNMSQEVFDERLSNAELARKLEREYFTLHNVKRKSSLMREDERHYSRERIGKQGLTGVKSSRKSSQEFLFNNSPERIKLVLRREQKDHSFMQLPQVEKTGFEQEIQDLHGWYKRPKMGHSKATFKIKPLEKKEHINIYKVTVKEKPELLSCVQNSEIQAEIKEYLHKSQLPSTSNTYSYLNSGNEEESKLKDHCYGKSKETNKKKPLLTVSQFQKEFQAVYVKTKESTPERCPTSPQSFEYKVVDTDNSKTSIFPEVLKTESPKPKFRREREYVEKQKRPIYRTAKILASSQPATRLLLRKSPQRTLLFPWSGKRNTHDSSDNKKEDLHLTSFKHLEKAKARARFDLGRSPADNQCPFKNFARPNTAPEFNKRLKESFGKFTNPRVVSAGLFHVNVTKPGLEEYNQKKDLKDLEKCSIICDILQLLNSSYVKRKFENNY